MSVRTVTVTQDINAPLERVFDWFYHSENFVQSPIVFRSDWATPTRWTPHSERDIVMIAG